MTETLTLPVPLTAPVTPVELRGLPLLDLVISQIELSPDSWNQEEWRCETGMCVAGWTSHLAGGQWAYPADGAGASYLLSETDDVGDDVEVMARGTSRERTVIAASDRAMRLLGLDADTADALFRPGNTLTDIKDLRDGIAGTLGD